MKRMKVAMNNKNQWLAMAMMIVSLSPAWAQDVPVSPQPEADVQDAQVSREPGMVGATGHTTEQMNHEAMPEMKHDSMSGMEDMDMEGMDHGAMQDKKPASTTLRDPHAYADGYDFSQFPMRHEGGDLKVGSLRIDRLETVRTDSNSFAAFKLQGRRGGDFDRAVVKVEGEIDNGKLQEGRTELLWSHAVTPFWDRQLGLRYDNGVNPDRGWLALGIQGLAPYWFEVDATAYIGDEGRTALRLDAEYELLLTQKLILQPRVEIGLNGKRDAEWAEGPGIADATAGVRLRYEIRREFAPYIGIEWAGKFGGTADYARAAGTDAKETRAVVGVRFWF